MRKAATNGRAPLLIHGLRDGTLALPGVLAAVVLGAAVSARLDADHVRIRPALVAAGAATAAAVVLAVGSPLHALLFSPRRVATFRRACTSGATP